MILRVLIARHDRQFKVVFRVYDISVFGGFGSDVDQGAAQGLELVSEAKQSVAHHWIIVFGYASNNIANALPQFTLPNHTRGRGGLVKRFQRLAVFGRIATLREQLCSRINLRKYDSRPLRGGADGEGSYQSRKVFTVATKLGRITNRRGIIFGGQYVNSLK